MIGANLGKMLRKHVVLVVSLQLFLSIKLKLYFVVGVCLSVSVLIDEENI